MTESSRLIASKTESIGGGHSLTARLIARHDHHNVYVLFVAVDVIQQTFDYLSSLDSTIYTERFVGRQSETRESLDPDTQRRTYETWGSARDCASTPEEAEKVVGRLRREVLDGYFADACGRVRACHAQSEGNARAWEIWFRDATAQTTER